MTAGGRPTVTWRDATAADRAFLRQLHDLNRLEFAALPDTVRAPLLDMQYRARERGYAAQYPHAHRMILISAADAVGQMLLAQEDTRVLLVDFAVLPAWQGMGVGKGALRLLQRHAAPRPVHLHVAAGSPAERLYARLGFRATGADAMNVHMEWRPDASHPDSD